MTQQQTVYIVKVMHHPGRGRRTYSRTDAEETQKLLQKVYKDVRIVEKKVR